LRRRSRNRYDGVDQFAVKYARTVAKNLVGQEWCAGSDLEDLEQRIIPAALEILKKHDPARGSKGALFAPALRNRVRNMIAFERAACRDHRLLGGSLQDPVALDDGHPEERGEVFDAEEYLRLTRGGPRPDDVRSLALDLARMRDALPDALRLVLDVLAADIPRAEAARQLGISRSTFDERRKALGTALEAAGIGEYLGDRRTFRRRSL